MRAPAPALTTGAGEPLDYPTTTRTDHLNGTPPKVGRRMSDRLSPLFTWRAVVKDSDLPPIAKLVAFVLSLHMNEAGGSAFPGVERLSRETSLARRTVTHWRAVLVELGFLNLVQRGGSPRGGKRLASEYKAATPSNYQTCWADLSEDRRRELNRTRPVTQRHQWRSVTGDVAPPVPVAQRPTTRGAASPQEDMEVDMKDDLSMAAGAAKREGAPAPAQSGGNPPLIDACWQALNKKPIAANAKNKVADIVAQAKNSGDSDDTILATFSQMTAVTVNAYDTVRSLNTKTARTNRRHELITADNDEDFELT